MLTRCRSLVQAEFAKRLEYAEKVRRKEGKKEGLWLNLEKVECEDGEK